MRCMDLQTSVCTGVRDIDRLLRRGGSLARVADVGLSAMAASPGHDEHKGRGGCRGVGHTVQCAGGVNGLLQRRSASGVGKLVFGLEGAHVKGWMLLATRSVKYRRSCLAVLHFGPLL